MKQYDVVVDVYSKTSSNIMSWFSKAKTKISKYKHYTSFIYSHTFKDAKIPKTNAGLAIENRLQLLEPLNISVTETIKPKIYLTEEEKYKIIPYICKYITVFNNIHEDEIELANFTNNIITIFS